MACDAVCDLFLSQAPMRSPHAQAPSAAPMRGPAQSVPAACSSVKTRAWYFWKFSSPL